MFTTLKDHLQSAISNLKTGLVDQAIATLESIHSAAEREIAEARALKQRIEAEAHAMGDRILNEARTVANEKLEALKAEIVTAEARLEAVKAEIASRYDATAKSATPTTPAPQQS